MVFSSREQQGIRSHLAGHIRGHILCERGQVLVGAGDPQHVPALMILLAAWTAANLEHIRRHQRLIADHRGPLDRYVIFQGVLIC